MSNYTYSIIIPHLNQPDLLIELLCSIPKRVDIQVIVCDDGSAEVHADKLQHIKNDFAVQWVDKPPELNSCVGLARNRGIDFAEGTYILFADSDDLLKGGVFRLLDEAIVEHAEAEIIYIDTAYEHLDQEGKLTRSYNEKRSMLLHEASKAQNRALYDKMYAYLSRLDTPWAKLIQREKAGNRMYFPNRPISDDVAQNMQLLDTQPKVAFLFTVGYVHREQPHSLSKTYNELFLTHRFDVSVAFNKWIRQKGWKEGYNVGGGYIFKAFKLKGFFFAWSFFKGCVLEGLPLTYPLHRYFLLTLFSILTNRTKAERHFYLCTGDWPLAAKLEDQ